MVFVLFSGARGCYAALRELESLGQSINKQEELAPSRIRERVETYLANLSLQGSKQEEALSSLHRLNDVLDQLSKTSGGSEIDSQRNLRLMAVGEVSTLRLLILSMADFYTNVCALIVLFSFCTVGVVLVLRRTLAPANVPLEVSESSPLEESTGYKLLNLMPVGVALVNENLQLFFVNKSLNRMTGWTKEEYQGTDLSSLLIDPLTGKRFNDRDTIFSKSLNSNIEVELACKNSDFLVASLSLLWAEVDGRRLLMANFLDTTSDYMLRKFKDDLGSMVRHDLIAPLSSMRLMSELMAQESYSVPTERGKQALTLMQGECARMERLVNDLLDLGKVSEGRLNLRTSLVEVAGLVNQVVSMLSKTAEAKKIAITSTVAQGMSVQMDRDRIMQVIVNLASNAIRYCPSGSRISLECAGDDDYVTITVSDNGPGIAIEEQQQIFDRYYQASRAADPTACIGHGLGLTICKLIVDAHDGIIGVDSTLGTGSRFWVRLPRKFRTT